MRQQRGCALVVGVSRTCPDLQVRHGRVLGERRGRRGERPGVPGGAGQLSAPRPMRAFRIAPAARGPPHCQMCQTRPPTVLLRATL